MLLSLWLSFQHDDPNVNINKLNSSKIMKSESKTTRKCCCHICDIIHDIAIHSFEMLSTTTEQQNNLYQYVLNILFVYSKGTKKEFKKYYEFSSWNSVIVCNYYRKTSNADARFDWIWHTYTQKKSIKWKEKRVKCDHISFSLSTRQ